MRPCDAPRQLLERLFLLRTLVHVLSILPPSENLDCHVGDRPVVAEDDLAGSRNERRGQRSKAFPRDRVGCGDTGADLFHPLRRPTSNRSDEKGDREKAPHQNRYRNVRKVGGATPGATDSLRKRARSICRRPVEIPAPNEKPDPVGPLMTYPARAW